MANKKISELAAAGALTGAELIETVQGGVNVQTTTQNIANLAPATPGAEAFLDLTDVPNSYSGEANKVVSVKADESGLEFTTASGTVTAGSGLSESGGVISFGSLSGEQTVTDGYHNIDPINGDSASLVFGELARFNLIDMRANELVFYPDNAAASVRTVFGGYGSGSVFNWFGVVNNQLVAGAGTLNGNVIVTQNGGTLSGVVNILHLRRAVTGASVGANGIGEKVVFSVKNGSGSSYSPEAGLSYILTDVTNGSEDSKYVLSALVNGVETTIAEFTGAGIAMGGNKITGLGAATANGDAVRYEQVIGVQDLFIPASAMWPRVTSGCSPLTQTEIATSLFNIQSLDFNQTTQQFAQFQIRLPRNWNNGTITFKPYWTATSGTGGVVWAVSGGAYSDDDALTVALGTAQTSTDTLIATNDLHIGPESSAITLAGSPADADFLAIQISRNPSDGSDTLTADAKLLGIAIRLTMDAAVAE